MSKAGNTLHYTIGAAGEGAKLAASAKANEMLAQGVLKSLEKAGVPPELLESEGVQAVARFITAMTVTHIAINHPGIIPDGIGAGRVATAATNALSVESMKVVKPMMDGIAPFLKGLAESVPEGELSAVEDEPKAAAGE